MDGFRQDWAENQDYIDWLAENWYVVADYDTLNQSEPYFPRVIYVKYIGNGTSQTNDNVLEQGKDITRKANETLLEVLFPNLVKTDGQSEDGFGTVDGNGLLGLGIFPNLGRFFKPLLTRLWWLLPLLILVLIFKFFKKK